MVEFGRHARLREIVEKEIPRNDAAVPDDDKISPRISGWLTGSAGYPSNSSGVTDLLGREEGLILEIWMGSFDRAGDAIDLVTAPEDSALGAIKYGVFMKYLIDRGAKTHRVILAEYVA